MFVRLRPCTSHAWSELDDWTLKVNFTSVYPFTKDVFAGTLAVFVSYARLASADVRSYVSANCSPDVTLS